VCGAAPPRLTRREGKLGALKLPWRWVETAIAASSIVSALKNLYSAA
jgi:hypothetical protein